MSSCSYRCVLTYFEHGYEFPCLVMCDHWHARNQQEAYKSFIAATIAFHMEDVERYTLAVMRNGRGKQRRVTR